MVCHIPLLTSSISYSWLQSVYTQGSRQDGTCFHKRGYSLAVVIEVGLGLECRDDALGGRQRACRAPGAGYASEEGYLSRLTRRGYEGCVGDSDSPLLSSDTDFGPTKELVRLAV
jgi:hypothetical protein